MGRVTVEESLFERMGRALVARGESVVWLAKGELPSPGDTVLSREGEPGFRFTFPKPVLQEADLSDDVGEALGSAASRFEMVLPDGSEVDSHDDVDWGSNQLPRVEWVTGPTVRSDGTVTISMDTDDAGFTSAMVERMLDILREVLEPLTDVEIGAEREVAGATIVWRPSANR